MSQPLATFEDPEAAKQPWWALLLTQAMLAGSAFFAPLDIAEGDSTRTSTVGMDLPVLCKLAISGGAFLIGTVGVLLSARVRIALHSIPGLLVLTLAALFLIASTQAVNSAGFPAAMIFLGYVLFVATALQQIGLNRVIQAMWVGMALFVVFGWVLYLFFPTYGVFSELLDDALVVTRMGGASHPNAFGRICLLTVLSATYLWRVRQLHSALFVLTLCVGGLAAYLSLSRTAMLSGVIAMLCLWLDVLWSRRGVAMLFIACGLAVIGLVGLVAIGKGGAIKQKLMSMVTKTGEMEEVKSGTGRNEIWQESVRLIKKRPWLGYGLNSGPALLVDFSQHTHNIVLNPTLSAGLVAGFVTVLLLCWNLGLLLTYPHLFIRAICAFILISGIVEDTILDTFPAPATLLWLITLFWPPLDAMTRSQTLVSEYTGGATESGLSPELP